MKATHAQIRKATHKLMKEGSSRQNLKIIVSGKNKNLNLAGIDHQLAFHCNGAILGEIDGIPIIVDRDAPKNTLYIIDAANAMAKVMITQSDAKARGIECDIYPGNFLTRILWKLLNIKIQFYEWKKL